MKRICARCGTEHHPGYSCPRPRLYQGRFYHHETGVEIVATYDTGADRGSGALRLRIAAHDLDSVGVDEVREDIDACLGIPADGSVGLPCKSLAEAEMRVAALADEIGDNSCQMHAVVGWRCPICGTGNPRDHSPSCTASTPWGR